MIDLIHSEKFVEWLMIFAVGFIVGMGVYRQAIIKHYKKRDL